MLGVAFSEGFRTNKAFYVFYTSSVDYSEVLSRLVVSSTNENRADSASEQVLLSIERPFTSVNSGQMAFGRDGYLYVGIGDGGFDLPVNSAQNKSSFLGKILRLDVESAPGAYRVPPSNPFVSESGYAPAIWALGVRNPYRFSFDRLNGDLYMGD